MVMKMLYECRQCKEQYDQSAIVVMDEVDFTDPSFTIGPCPECGHDEYIAVQKV